MRVGVDIGVDLGYGHGCFKMVMVSATECLRRMLFGLCVCVSLILAEVDEQMFFGGDVREDGAPQVALVFFLF